MRRDRHGLGGVPHPRPWAAPIGGGAANHRGRPEPPVRGRAVAAGFQYDPDGAPSRSPAPCPRARALVRPDCSRYLPGDRSRDPGMRSMRVSRVAIIVVLLVVYPVVGAGAVTTVVPVRPGALAGWSKIHENTSAGAPSGAQSFISGPGSPPSGTGSLWMTSGSRRARRGSPAYDRRSARGRHDTRLHDVDPRELDVATVDGVERKRWFRVASS